MSVDGSFNKKPPMNTGGICKSETKVVQLDGKLWSRFPKSKRLGVLVSASPVEFPLFVICQITFT